MYKTNINIVFNNLPLNNLIVIEGIDGSGKTTICSKLKEELNINSKINFNFSSCPNKSYPLYKEIRNLLVHKKEIENSKKLYKNDYFTNRSLLNLFLADMYMQAETIYNNTESIYILDRYIVSTLAYQELEFNATELISLAKCLPPPKFIIYLDITPDLAMKRIDDGSRELEKYENLETLTKIYKNYKTILMNLKYHDYTNENISYIELRTVDASQDINIVYQEVLNIIKKDIINK
jgi:dTMP kinase